MRIVPCLVAVVAALGLVGCEAHLGGSFETGGRDDNSLRPDAATSSGSPDAQGIADAAPAAVSDNACGVASSFGDLGSLAGSGASALQPNSTTQRRHWVAARTPNTATSSTPDYIQIDLWDNFGAFAGGAARAGTFTISGNDADYDTCGVCVMLAANVTNGTPTKVLLATAGTVTITSVGTAAGQTTRATVTNASFIEIAYTEGVGYQPVAGSSCTSPLTRAELSATL